MLGFGRRKKADTAKEADRAVKITESQRALLNAAISTADAAQEVTTMLKSKLDEIIEQFNHTARILRDALVICDAAGIITYFNPAAEILFGVSYKEALGTPVLGLFKGTGTPIRNTAELWVKLQNTDEDDLLGVHSTGSSFRTRVGFSVLERDGGQNAILLLIRNPEDCGACGSNSRYSAIFETTFDGIVIAKAGMIVAANPSCVRLFGHPTSEMINKEISMLVVDRDKDAFLSIILDVNNSKEKNFLAEGVNENGRLLSLIYTVTEVDWEGESAALITMRDITEMKRLEKIVAMKRDNGIDMACAFDANFSITFANQTFAAGHGAHIQDVLGHDIRDFVPDRGSFERAILSLNRNNPSYRTHVADGKTFQDWISHGVFDDTGAVIEYHYVGRVLGEELTTAIKSSD